VRCPMRFVTVYMWSVWLIQDTVHTGIYLWIVGKKELHALPNEVCDCIHVDCIYVEFVTHTRHSAHWGLSLDSWPKRALEVLHVPNQVRDSVYVEFVTHTTHSVDICDYL